MASKVKKGFLYYLLWVVFIALGIFCILLAILMFNPGKDVLGIGLRYVSDRSVVKYDQVDVNGNKEFIKDLNIDTIEINSKFTNFEVIRNADYEQFKVVVDKKIIGFSQTDKVNHVVTLSLDGKTLKVDVTEPELWISLSPTATVTLVCPKNLTLKDHNININTKSGRVMVGEGETYAVELNGLNVKTETGEVNINSASKFQTGIVNIETKTSPININSNITNELNIITDSSKIFINKIDGNFNVEATELEVKANKILGNVKFSSQKGYIRIGELGNLTTMTNGNFTSVADKTSIANVIIEKMAGDLVLPTADKSNIEIGELCGEALIETTSGNVTIEKANNVLSIKTNSGDVEFTQTSKLYTDVKTISGKITANFADIGTAILETEKADIKVNTKQGLLFAFNYSTKNEISVSWITTALAKVGTIYSPNGENSPNSITATVVNSGDISLANNY